MIEFLGDSRIQFSQLLSDRAIGQTCMVFCFTTSHITSSLMEPLLRVSCLPLSDICTIILVDLSFQHNGSIIGSVIMQNGEFSLCWGCYLRKRRDVAYAKMDALLEALFKVLQFGLCSAQNCPDCILWWMSLMQRNFLISRGLFFNLDCKL